MTDDEWVNRLQKIVEDATPEGVVGMLAQLSVQRTTFKDATLYQSLFTTIAGKLYLKCLAREQ